MTTRDRIVVMVIAVLVVLGGGWMLIVSPERKHAAKLQGEVDTAASQLASAQGALASARAAQARYSSAYSAIVNLGKAVPPGREVPSLVYELAQASNQRHVDLSSIVYQSAGGSGGSASAAQAAASTVAGFTQMPFTFVFNGSFGDLYNLFQQLNHYTVRTSKGAIKVRGRLLTIQSAKLAPVANGSGTGTSKSTQLSGTVTATAYVLPAAQGLTAGATPSSPAGSSASPASSTSSGGRSPTAPAIARVNP
jgi:Tfp pilus assembly protein PilO